MGRVKAQVMGTSMSWVETVLEEWGTWLRTKGAGQGWGGAVDLDRLFELARAPRTPGVHSDPTYAEFASTAHDGQGRMQTVNRYVLQCSPDVRLVGRLRYAGLLEPVAEPGPKDRARWNVSRGTFDGCPERWADVEMGGVVWWGESGGVPMSRIAVLMACDLSRVHGLLGALHKQIRAELLEDARTRKTNADANPRRLRA